MNNVEKSMIFGSLLNANLKTSRSTNLISCLYWLNQKRKTICEFLEEPLRARVSAKVYAIFRANIVIATGAIVAGIGGIIEPHRPNLSDNPRSTQTQSQPNYPYPFILHNTEGKKRHHHHHYRRCCGTRKSFHPYSQKINSTQVNRNTNTYIEEGDWSITIDSCGKTGDSEIGYAHQREKRWIHGIFNAFLFDHSE